MASVISAFAAQEETPAQSTPSNLEVIQSLSFEIADSLARMLGEHDSVRVLVRPPETAWYVEGALLSAFSRHGHVPTQSLSAAREVDIGLLNAGVTYSNIHRSGVFAPRLVDRTVSVEFAGKVVDNRSGVIVHSTNMIRSVSDTIDVSDIARLESPGIPATRGVLPQEGFFSSLLEPLVMMGAVAVAVFLLFRIRS